MITMNIYPTFQWLSYRGRHERRFKRGKVFHGHFEVACIDDWPGNFRYIIETSVRRMRRDYESYFLREIGKSVGIAPPDDVDYIMRDEGLTKFMFKPNLTIDTRDRSYMINTGGA